MSETEIARRNDHVHKGIPADMIALWPLVCGGGVLVGHDFSHQPRNAVNKAVEEFAKESGRNLGLTFPERK